jgi:hypothetical protein
MRKIRMVYRVSDNAVKCKTTAGVEDYADLYKN